MKILFIGDIFGNVGRRVLAERLSSLVEDNGIDVCVGNGENVSGGRGMTKNLFRKLRKYGLNVITGGNHSFSVGDNDYSFMAEPVVLRPLNYPPNNLGHGSTIFTLPDGRKIGVINAMGRTFMHDSLDCPFRMTQDAVDELKKETPVILIDLHAEASSEKAALAWHLDGQISALIGTHTHVQTADERILPKGTAFITDAGMTGPGASIIGMKPEGVIRKYMLQTYVRFEPSDEGAMLNGVIIEVDDGSGKAVSISRVFEQVTLRGQHIDE
ncbi:MAG: TIGR00282 family metallophosphoesterase [Chitinispirillia bacterium]|nr:TIGR00282 family metallophosphoesterase [Chitinispirillia bacterium]MCL2268982.1 TIGR00282 family metallophosphoesterase [Chitinispirillia bacterium]